MQLVHWPSASSTGNNFAPQLGQLVPTLMAASGPADLVQTPGADCSTRRGTCQSDSVASFVRTRGASRVWEATRTLTRSATQPAAERRPTILRRQPPRRGRVRAVS